MLYRCNKAKQRGKQCEKAIALLYLIGSDEVQLHMAENDHTCDDNSRPHKPMSPSTKEKITAMFTNGTRKRKAMQTQLASEKIPVPSKNQLNNLIKDLRMKHFGLPTMTLGQLEEKLMKHTSVPDDDDESFIVDYRIDYDTQDFKFFISSKKLLRNAINAEVVSADTTYKMIWNGFPVSPVGTIDTDRHFHLFGTMVSKEEQKKDFKFMFNALKKGVAKLVAHQMKPTILISDASDAIRNGFQEVFGDNTLLLMCWFHVKKAVKENAAKLIKTKKVQKEMLDDLTEVHKSNSPHQFQTAVKLFLVKYKKHDAFCSYFQKEWIKQHQWIKLCKVFSVYSYPI